MKYLRFNLLENALDSLSLGVRFALKDEPTSSDLKLSILLLTQAVELVLKEKLKREHWSLVYKNIEKAGNPKAITVTIDEAIKRLEQVGNVKLEPSDKKVILNLSDIRNGIQHYEIEITFEEVVGKAHSAIAMISRFLKDELNSDIREILNKEDIQGLLDISETLEQLQEMARQNIEKIRMENEPIRLKDNIRYQFEVIICPECWQDYYVFSPDSHISQCQLCTYEGGVITCIRCGRSEPSGTLDFHTEGPDYALCNNCWADIGKE